MNEFSLLVVDDEPLVGEFVCEISEQAGFDAVHLTHGQSLLDSFNNKASIIILDLMMPDIDGIELIRFIAEQNSQVSLILMSGIEAGILHAAQELAREHGINLLGTLQKPFHPRKLSKLLNTWKQSHTTKGEKYGHELIGSAIAIAELEYAIDNHQLIPYYQPQISLKNHKILGFEVLIRWQHPQRGLLPPEAFIPLAEKSGLINNLSWKLIDMVAKQWSQSTFLYNLSVNMPAGIFKILDMPERLESIITEHKLDTSQLILEITETAVMEELVKSLDCLTRLRMKGFQLSIDDFGTGYSSLVQLHRVPVSEIKIDMQFVKKMEHDKEALAIVETVIMLANKLGVNVVAEGVETIEVYQQLAKLGADIAQGFYLSKPMPANQIEHWVNAWNSEAEKFTKKLKQGHSSTAILNLELNDKIEKFSRPK